MEHRADVIRDLEATLGEAAKVKPGTTKASQTALANAKAEARAALALVRAEPEDAQLDLRPWITPLEPQRSIGTIGASTTIAPGVYEDVAFKGEIRRESGETTFKRCLFAGPHGRGEGASLLYLMGGVTRHENCEFRESEGRAGIYQNGGVQIPVNPWVHDNGTGPLFQQIYIAGGEIQEGQGGRIEKGFDYGLQFYSPPEYRNPIGPVNWAGAEIRECSHGGVVFSRRTSNAVLFGFNIHNNGEYGVYGYNVEGSGNAVRGSNVWGNKQNFAGSGFSKEANSETAP